MNTEDMDTLPEAPDQNRLVGQRLRAIREARGCSKTTLGKALRISSQQVHKYETGENRITAGRLMQAATYLGVSLGTFFGPNPAYINVNGLSDRFIIALDDAMVLGRAANSNLAELAKIVREMEDVRAELLKYWPEG